VTAYDVVFVGSSPNALAGAARLARAHRRVLVIDDRGLGGPVATAAFAPGFHGDLGVPAIALADEIYDELGLSVERLRREVTTALAPGVAPVRLDRVALPRGLALATDFMRALHRVLPPNVPALGDGDRAVLHDVAARLTARGPRQLHDVLGLLFAPARHYFEDCVADEVARGALCAIATRGRAEGPFAEGTMFGYLHHAALDDGLTRSTARGGCHRVAVALADAARAAGAELRCDAVGPITIAVERGVATAVVLGDGTRMTASAIVSDRDATTTLTRMVSPRELAPEFNRALRALRYRGTTARVHLALDGVPDFAGIDREALAGTLIVAPSIAYVERSWDQAKRGAMPEQPVLELAIPTLADPSLAPPGKHVLDVSVQHVPWTFRDHRAVLDRVLAVLSPIAPRLHDQVLHHHVACPVDLEEQFGLPDGQLYAGEVRLDQAFWLRPLPGFARYETPIERLFLAGSAAHPGGYSGLSGWGVAKVLLDRPHT
jgi:phytoene dehydrogenase-like protein